MPSEHLHRSNQENTFDNLFKNVDHTKEDQPLRNSQKKEISPSPRKDSVRVHSIPEENEDDFKASAPKVESNSSPRPIERQPSGMSGTSFSSLPSEKKQIKLAHGKFTLKEFASYLRSYPFH